ncbi:hypothetical protein CYLTODRAFT_382949, partial [Cylindrobasidium torrendii FP15055 ss-10]
MKVGEVTSTSSLVQEWIADATKGAPLITYTNEVRDIHNHRMTRAYAEATHQEHIVYYAVDRVGKGSDRIVLKGQNAEDAWNTPPKQAANDLAGRLSLAIGMPVIVTENVLVKEGISNGSRGILEGIEYYTDSGRRHATSVTVKLVDYKGVSRSVDIPYVIKDITYKKAGVADPYRAKRQQVPIVAGFACTVHNSQSMSVTNAILH